MEEYLRRSILLGSRRLEKYVFTGEKPKPERQILERLTKEIRGFLENPENKVVLLYGLRGVGKTTMLAQAYFKFREKIKSERIIYISVDDASMLGANIREIFETYERMIGERLEELSEPTVFLLDEVHYDENWDLAIKTAYDKGRNLLIVATGSSALSIKLSTDLARRSKKIHVSPLTFSEYLLLKHNIQMEATLKDSLRKAFLSCNFNGVEDELRKALLKFDPIEVENYLIEGSLPVFLRSDDPLADAYSIIERIIRWDIAKMDFSEDTLERTFHLLLLLASGESLDYETLTSSLELSKPVVSRLISVLEKLEVIFPIRAYGSIGKVARKTPKYKFLAPMLRSAVLDHFDLLERDEKTLGVLLEDAVALYLYLIAREKGYSLTYDAQKGGADFILSMSTGRKIVIEVGWGKKGAKQVRKTMKKVNSDCGLVIHNGKFKVEQGITWIPKEWFLLML